MRFVCLTLQTYAYFREQQAFLTNYFSLVDNQGITIYFRVPYCGFRFLVYICLMKTGKKLGQALAKLRTDNGDSRYKMAKESGIKIDTIERLEETGKGNICTVFNILIHYKAEMSIIKK